MDELYVLARRVLLDALGALGKHRDAIVVVGAQAVYLRVGEADIAVAPFTTDGDLAIDPAVLGEVPRLELALMEAGFLPKAKDSVGVWSTQRAMSDGVLADVSIDLLVPASVSPGKGRRAARLRGHDTCSARIVKGLEGAIVDADVMRLTALDHADDRFFDVRVAGAAALLVAKVHKIKDREGRGRKNDKDALDVLRLLRGTETHELATRYRRLLTDERSVDTARAALALLTAQFGSKSGIGVQMAIRSAGVLVDGDEIAGSCEALTLDLLSELNE